MGKRRLGLPLEEVQHVAFRQRPFGGNLAILSPREPEIQSERWINKSDAHEEEPIQLASALGDDAPIARRPVRSQVCAPLARKKTRPMRPGFAVDYPFFYRQNEPTLVSSSLSQSKRGCRYKAAWVPLLSCLAKMLDRRGRPPGLPNTSRDSLQCATIYSARLPYSKCSGRRPTSALSSIRPPLPALQQCNS